MPPPNGSTPFDNKRWEAFCHLICLGRSSATAYAEAGFSNDPSGANASKFRKRPDIEQRIAFMRGEVDLAPQEEPAAPSADQAEIIKHLLKIAYADKTPPAATIKALELVHELSAKDEHWPGDADFDISRLSERQLQLCQLFVARPVRLNPADAIIAKLATMNREKAEIHAKESSAADRDSARMTQSCSQARSNDDPAPRGALNIAAHGAR